MVEVGDRVKYTRRDYPGGTTIISILPATVIEIGPKKIKIRLDKPHIPIKKGFKGGKPIIETWVEPHNIGLPMRKDYKRASGCLILFFFGSAVLIVSAVFIVLVI